MTPSLIVACLWLVAANVVAMFPSRRHHWPAAWVLIALGVPLLVWTVIQNGWLVGAIVAIAGMSILRWPTLYLARWLRGLGRGR